MDHHDRPGDGPAGRPSHGGTSAAEDLDPSSTGPHWRSVVVGLAVTVLFVVVDQLTKEYVLQVLRPGEFVPWLGERIGWQLVFNPGGAFGLPAPPLVFLVVSGIVLVVVLRALPRTGSLLQATAFGLLLAGALGNVLDRLFRAGAPEGGLATGYVVDFVAWGAFPRFNVADSAITVGFVLLVIALLIEERRHRELELAEVDDAPRADAPAGEAPAGEAPTTDVPPAEGPAAAEPTSDAPAAEDDPPHDDPDR